MLGRAAACNAKPTKSPGTTTPLLKIDFGIGIYSISSDTDELSASDNQELFVTQF